MTPLTYFNADRQRLEELTALDFRVLICVAWHDRHSGARGSEGCYASNLTLAAEVGCTVTSISRALRHLLEAGLISVERATGRRQCTVYRVIYDEQDKNLIAQRGNSLLPNRASARQQVLARDGVPDGEAVAPATSQNGRIPPQASRQEILLKKGRDTPEGVEKTHLKGGRAKNLSRAERDREWECLSWNRDPELPQPEAREFAQLVLRKWYHKEACAHLREEHDRAKEFTGIADIRAAIRQQIADGFHSSLRFEEFRFEQDEAPRRSKSRALGSRRSRKIKLPGELWAFDSWCDECTVPQPEGREYAELCLTQLGKERAAAFLAKQLNPLPFWESRCGDIRQVLQRAVAAGSTDLAQFVFRQGEKHAD